MDLLSQSLRTLFYDINVKDVVGGFYDSCDNYLQSEFVNQTTWHSSSFTRTEVIRLQKYIVQELSKASKRQSSFKWHSLFHLLPLLANECLKIEGSEPIVRYDEILRWRYISLLLSEDIFTSSFLAKQNIEGIKFDWPNVVKSSHLNDIFDGGLSDTHAHLYATADVFELTWLDFMNNVDNRNDDYRKLFNSAEAIITTRRDTSCYRIDTIIQIAAYLRCAIVETLRNDKISDNLRNAVTYFDDHKSRNKNLVDLQARITNLSKGCTRVKLKGGEQVLDYALNTVCSSSIYSVHVGERNMLYTFFKKYYKNDPVAISIANYVFLYEILKIAIRREFVQTNCLPGFDNFKIYESRKSLYSNKYIDLYPTYAIQSSIRPNKDDSLEARVTPVNVPDRNFQQSIFGTETQNNINRDTITFVVHMLKDNGKRFKSPYPGLRYGYKEHYRSQIDAIIEDARLRSASLDKYAKFYAPEKNVYDIVGVDAAGSELICPPAVFGHVYRYARKRGLVNLTYHVGEDFLDLVDGLLSVYEALIYLDLGDGCRLGHANALGVNVRDYYYKRSFQVAMSAQRLLDCLVCILVIGLQKKNLSYETYQKLRDEAREIYEVTIGYKQPFNISAIFYSMYLRSDELYVSKGGSYWVQSADCLDPIAVKARMNSRAYSLNVEYLTHKDIIEKGEKTCLFEYPKEIVPVIEEIQSMVINKVVSRNIVVESNPSSNYKIGPFDRYEDLPLYKFDDTHIPFSINTDDKGVFATSLTNELTLVASAYQKDSIQFIQDVIKRGKDSRFKADSNHIIV